MASNLTRWRMVCQWKDEPHHHISKTRFQRLGTPSPISPTLPASSVNPSVVSDSLWPHGLWPARLLSPWDSPPDSSSAVFAGWDGGVWFFEKLCKFTRIFKDFYHKESESVMYLLVWTTELRLIMMTFIKHFYWIYTITYILYTKKVRQREAKTSSLVAWLVRGKTEFHIRQCGSWVFNLWKVQYRVKGA